MKYDEIKLLGLEECSERLSMEQASRQKIIFAHAISPIRNPMRIRDNRRLIARLKTAMRVTEKLKN